MKPYGLLITLVCLGGVMPIRAETTRLTLAPVGEIDLGDYTLETNPRRVPDYLRALAATQPDTVKPFAKLLQTTLTGGSLTADCKIAMGYTIAARLQNRYAQQHFARLLKSTGSQNVSLQPTSKSDTLKVLDERTRLAVAFASRLTDDVHGIDDAFFGRLRPVFNDGEIVELTQTVCTWNYFVRLCAAMGLTPEGWLNSTVPKPLQDHSKDAVHAARVTLATDAEMEWAAKIVSPTGGDPWGLGVRVFNSQRAMLRSPEMGFAWMDYWQSVRTGAKVPRSMLLHVSYAVSTKNGCRYCVVHQTVGLRRTGSDNAKLQAMSQSDALLSPTEKAAVTFARKLTQNPLQVSDADFAALQAAFPGSQAMEIIMQTCAFSYMNRFTDNLRLPSEDEAVKIYEEVYGDGSLSTFYKSHRIKINNK